MKAPKTLEGSITLNYSIPYELILGDVSADGRSVECVVRFPDITENGENTHE